MYSVETHPVHPHRATEEVLLHNPLRGGSIYRQPGGQPRASQIWSPLFDLTAVRGLNPLRDREQIISFGRNQLLTEADEHAARSVISTHTGYIEEGRFMVNDFDMLKATENALRAQPDNLRIQAEYTGLRAVMENMRSGSAQVILSPAKEGMTYGLGFVFVPGNPVDGVIPVTQKIILFDHEGGGTRASASIRDRLLELGDKQNRSTPPTTAEEYISSPLTISDVSLTDGQLVSLFGSDPAKVSFAIQFRELLTQYAGAQMQEYGELLVKHSRNGGADHEFKRQASHIKDTVFALGTKLAYAMRTNDWGEFRVIVRELAASERKGGLALNNQAIEALLMNAATVIGGTQCPPSVLNRSTGMDILGNRHLDVMKNYEAEWDPVTECVRCPNCQVVSSAENPHFIKGGTYSCGNERCILSIHQKKTLM